MEGSIRESLEGSVSLRVPYTGFPLMAGSRKVSGKREFSREYELLYRWLTKNT
jgi:hypothetical protein